MVRFLHQHAVQPRDAAKGNPQDCSGMRLSGHQTAAAFKQEMSFTLPARPAAVKMAHWLQMDGFGSDSTRMITMLRKASPGLQLLLFSATFNERVKDFALRVAGPDANQVCSNQELSVSGCTLCRLGSHLPACVWLPFRCCKCVMYLH